MLWEASGGGVAAACWLHRHADRGVVDPFPAEAAWRAGEARIWPVKAADEDEHCGAGWHEQWEGVERAKVLRLGVAHQTGERAEANLGRERG